MTTIDNKEFESIKARAMVLKLRRFNLVSIKLVAYYSMLDSATIMFIDESGHVWYPNTQHNRQITYVAKTADDKKWLKHLSKQQLKTNLGNRFSITLNEEHDFEKCFDWLAHCASQYGDLKICQIIGLDNLNTSFFTKIDTPESVIVQFDLCAPLNVSAPR